VENAARTLEYRAVMRQRRDALRDHLAAILPLTAPFAWEVGCGHGHFLTAYAAEHKSRLCVGIDIIGERIARAKRKRDRALLGNLHFIQAEAGMFLESMPAAAGFNSIFILFPDPWPKLRHQKNRVLKSAFLTAAASRATSDCRLYFRTDHAGYFDAARAAVMSHAAWECVDEPWPYEFETVFQSKAPAHHSLIARRRP
jgi:tRNA (guanine-N7-)-methyltransferase